MRCDWIWWTIVFWANVFRYLESYHVSITESCLWSISRSKQEHNKMHSCYDCYYFKSPWRFEEKIMYQCGVLWFVKQLFPRRWLQQWRWVKWCHGYDFQNIERSAQIKDRHRCCWKLRTVQDNFQSVLYFK